MFNAPEAPQSVMEALTQRLDKYKSTESSAKAAGEGSKARRMGRIVKVGVCLLFIRRFLSFKVYNPQIFLQFQYRYSGHGSIKF